MRFLRVLPLVVFYPASVLAAGAGGDAGGFSFASSFLQMIVSLAVVIGVIMVFHYLSRRWMKGAVPGSSHNRYIRVVENRFLAPKKALLLVEVAGEYMLLSSCGDNINFIKQVDMIEEVEIIGEVSHVTFREAFQDKMKSFSARFPVGSGAFSSSLRKAGVRS